MKIFFWSAAILSLTLSAADGPARPQSLEKRRMLAAAGRMKTDDRIAWIEKAAAENKQDPEIRTALAAAFLQKLRENGDGSYLTRASAILDRLAADAPGYRPAARLRLQVDMQLHHFPQVAARAEVLLAEDPSDATTLGMLGDALMELGRYPEAGDAYRRMTSLGGNLFSYNRLAWYEFVTGKPEAALGWMAQAVAAGSPAPENRAWCLTELGDMLLKLGRTADAGQAYSLALAAFPGYHRAHAGLGRALAAKGEMPAAVSHLRAAQNVVPLPEYAAQLEKIFRGQGSTAEADHQREMLDLADTLSAASGEKANRNLALAFADEGRKLDRALAMVNAEFEVRNDVYSYDALAWVLFKMNRLEEARRASDRALALHTPEPMFEEHAQAIARALPGSPP